MRRLPIATVLGRWMALVAIAGFGLLCGWQNREACAAEEVLASVKGSPIRDADVQLEAILRRVPPEQVSQRQSELVEELIDLRLISLFLASRRVKANPIELDQQVERIHGLIRHGEEEPEDFFRRVGLSEEQLRDRLELGLAWQAYVRQRTTAKQLRQYFDAHRRELNGTQLRARHIILKSSSEESKEREAALRLLSDVRRQVESGSLPFAAAAAKFSEGPSRREGGDVGFFAHRGMMSADFADAAFSLKVGELSEPVETAFGVHLIEVSDERPGQLSLEDVREQVLARISRQLWSEQVARDRARVPITRANSAN